jgi:hypothetical protein
LQNLGFIPGYLMTFLECMLGQFHTENSTPVSSVQYSINKCICTLNMSEL